MKKQFFTLFALLLLFVLPFSAQEIEVNGSRKAVRTSGDIGAVLLPVAGLTAVFVQQDWQGLKQGVFSAISTAGITYALKYLVKKDRPDHSDNHSFPSMHTATYILSTYVGWSRVYGKKHDGWDVLAGAAIGAGCSYIFTRPFAQKHQLSISPMAGDGYCGLYASMRF